MTCRIPLKPFFAALCLALASCSKHDSKPNSNTTSNVGTLNINCYAWFLGPQTELIVSEPGGEILLDTIATNSSTPIVTALKTNDTLVDVTQISPSAGNPTVNVYTIKSVNLARIKTLNIKENYSNEYKRPINYTKSQIIYYNIPSQVNLNNFDFFFANYPLNGALDMQGNRTDNNLEVTFDNYQGDFAFILFPQEGLYNLHLQQNNIDSVDCSHLDTTTKLTFNRPVPFTTTSISQLYGILDTTDLTRTIAFTDYVQPYSKPGVDYEYAPLATIQKYEMEYSATLPNNDQLYVYSYTNTLPQTLPRPKGNDYLVTSAQVDNFNVTFPKTTPTCYQLYLQADSTIRYTMFISPDSAAVHPLSFLANLKSKLLPGAHLSNLKLNRFSMWDYDGLNYLNYCSYITNSSPTSTNHATSVAIMSRVFN